MLTELEYFKSVKGLAREILDEAIRRTAEDFDVYSKENVLDVLNDEGLLYTYTNDDELVIYTKYHLDILRYTLNEEVIYSLYADEDLCSILRGKGIVGLIEVQAALAYAEDVYAEILEMELFDE